MELKLELCLDLECSNTPECTMCNNDDVDNLDALDVKLSILQPKATTTLYLCKCCGTKFEHTNHS